MGKKIKILLLLLAFTSFNLKAQVYLDSLNKQANAMLLAFSKQDYKELLKFTHPKIVEILGGDEKAAVLLSETMSELKKSRMVIKYAGIGTVVQSVTTPSSVQCIIPQTLEVQIGEQISKSKNYLFGISYDKGMRWYFLDTAGAKEEDLRKLFTEMSKDIIIPKSESTYN